jgi:aryl-alcohol dehydrogenase-like predicted oxidoreductase
MNAVTEVQLANNLVTKRVLNGLWQVSGAHGAIDPRAAVNEMFAYHDARLTTWDLADHYGPAEDFIGEFRRRMKQERGESALDEMQAFTKWVPRPMKITRQIVQDAIDVSRKRMEMPTLDLVQFHWWDYADENYLVALDELAHLRAEGVIKQIALTNFDTKRLRTIHAHGVRVVSNQVQYSLIDQRPEKGMIPYCAEKNVFVLAYGTLCGGLLSEKYLGAPEPRGYELPTASLRKYKQMVEAWGDWGLFQTLLRTLQSIGERYKASIANVAVRYVLDEPQVAGVIVGARLGVAQHIADTERVFEFELDAEDIQRIHRITEQARDLYKNLGDCGSEYRQ